MGWFGLAVRTLLLDPKGPAKGPAWFGLAGGAPIRNPGGSGLGLSDISVSTSSLLFVSANASQQAAACLER